MIFFDLVVNCPFNFQKAANPYCMPYLLGERFISVLTQISTNLWTTFERNKPLLCIKEVFTPTCVKNGSKNKSVVHLWIYWVDVYQSGLFLWVNLLLNFKNVSCKSKVLHVWAEHDTVSECWTQVALLLYVQTSDTFAMETDYLFYYSFPWQHHQTS